MYQSEAIIIAGYSGKKFLWNHITVWQGCWSSKTFRL